MHSPACRARSLPDECQGQSCSLLGVLGVPLAHHHMSSVPIRVSCLTGFMQGTLPTAATTPVDHLTFSLRMDTNTWPNPLCTRTRRWSGACVYEVPHTGGELAIAAASHFGQALSFYQGERLVRATCTLHPPAALAALPKLACGQGGAEHTVACAEGHQVRRGGAGGGGAWARACACVHACNSPALFIV